MYLSSTLPMWAALQALTYWVSVRPELINPCKTPNKKDTSVSLHNVNLTKKQKRSLLLPQIRCVLSTGDTTGIPLKGMTRERENKQQLQT